MSVSQTGGGLDYYEDSLVLLIVHQASTERVHQYELYQHEVMSVSQTGGGVRLLGGLRLMTY